MKRTDIRAGVVYAAKASYAAPVPIVFLEDGAAGLYERQRNGTGIRKLEENKYTKAKRGSGWSETTRGYAAVIANYNTTKPEAAELLATIDPAAELARFEAGESPSADGLSFDIRYTLSDIGGLYADEKAAYEEAQAAEREQRRRKQEADNAAHVRRRAIVEALNAHGIAARDNSAGKVELTLDEGDKLIALLRGKA